mmetsp:Transcript_126467/g.282693  ORF Transcript_126467/g.282693 Transcript_126467/m.282693 type:complete len:82 (-) Transcript_126467:16-261(-)
MSKRRLLNDKAMSPSGFFGRQAAAAATGGAHPHTARHAPPLPSQSGQAGKKAAGNARGEGRQQSGREVAPGRPRHRHKMYI